MKLKHTLMSALLIAMTGAVFAQTGMVERNVEQQKRIEDGLKTGELTTREAARLEKEQSNVERMQSKVLRDGTVTKEEQARINNAQNKVSQDIYREKHDAQTGNPNSASSKRMQADVARNINQQQRIENGLKSGQLTNHEAAKLERGEAHLNRRQAAAGRDGHISGREQARIARAENRESRRIHHERHDAQRKHHHHG